VNPADLREEIAVELEAMEVTVKELLALQQDVAEREPTLRENTAAAAFLAQFYNGLENILKRISHFHGVPVPTSETWHVELFQRFSDPAYPDLPQLFDTGLAAALAPYRRFRHVAFHSYGFQLDWHRMSEGIKNIQNIFDQITDSLSTYLESIEG
jgi:hypothetical protein